MRENEDKKKDICKKKSSERKDEQNRREKDKERKKEAENNGTVRKITKLKEMLVRESNKKGKK